MSPPSIIFLIPYFGKWPFWMPFFLESCRHNPDIDWLFFTDCGVPADAPANVRFHETSFADYCAYVTQQLGISFHPDSPYKLCDLKPALGLVHAADIAAYDFWGFSDIDLVYGDLRAYFTADRLAKHRLLSTHARRISGHLCLLRNTPEMLNCFKQVPDWQEMLSSNQHFGFDERAYTQLFIHFKKWPTKLRKLLSLSNPLWRQSEFIEAYSTPYGRLAWHDGSFNFPEYWRWKQGKLSNSQDGERNFPYFHFIGWKERSDWRAEACKNSTSDPTLPKADSWVVTPQGFKRCAP